jgi:hypothetical protein
VKNLHNAVIGGRLPDEFTDVDIAQDDGHLDVGRPQPEEDLPRATQLAELREHQTDGAGYVLVRINLDLATFVPAKARRQHEPEFAAFRLRVTGGDASLSHQTQLVFRHRSLQPEQQAIVDDSRIIGAIRINNQRAGKRAQIDEMMPIPPVARQA